MTLIFGCASCAGVAFAELVPVRPTVAIGFVVSGTGWALVGTGLALLRGGRSTGGGRSNVAGVEQCVRSRE